MSIRYKMGHKWESKMYQIMFGVTSAGGILEVSLWVFGTQSYRDLSRPTYRIMGRELWVGRVESSIF